MSRRHLPGGTLTAPLPPALVTVGEGEEANVLTVAWTGILCSTPPKTYVSVRPTRHSYALLKKYGEFVIHLPTEKLARAVDFCGMYTGAKVDKFDKCKLTKTESKVVKTPTIAECPVALECRVTDVIPLGTHDVIMADIVNVSCDDALFDDSGKLHMEKAGLLAYAHGEYFTLGRRVGKFGFSAAKKKNGAKATSPARKKPTKKNGGGRQ